MFQFQNGSWCPNKREDRHERLTHLKWSWRATLKSKESPRSANPRPINACRPLKTEVHEKTDVLARILYRQRIFCPKYIFSAYQFAWWRISAGVFVMASYHCRPLSAPQSICWNLWLPPPHIQDTAPLGLGQTTLLRNTEFSLPQSWIWWYGSEADKVTASTDMSATAVLADVAMTVGHLVVNLPEFLSSSLI